MRKLRPGPACRPRLRRLRDCALPTPPPPEPERSCRRSKRASLPSPSVDQMDGRVKVVGQVERVDGASLTYAEFVDRFMAPNRPVVLTGLTASWRACEDWTLPGPGDRRRPDLSFFARNFPSPLVQVSPSSSPMLMTRCACYAYANRLRTRTQWCRLRRSLTAPRGSSRTRSTLRCPCRSSSITGLETLMVAPVLGIARAPCCI